jgi:hypothetical protein
VVSAATRARNANRHLPARWIDVARDAAGTHAFAHTAMARRGYTPRGPVDDGVAYYQYGTPVRQFFSDVLSFGIVRRLLGRPDGYALLAVWTEPVAGGTRVTVSLVTGLFHAAALHETLAELITDVDAAGALLQAGAPFSGINLPADSPGRPLAHGRSRTA